MFSLSPLCLLALGLSQTHLHWVCLTQQLPADIREEQKQLTFLGDSIQCVGEEPLLYRHVWLADEPNICFLGMHDQVPGQRVTSQLGVCYCCSCVCKSVFMSKT